MLLTTAIITCLVFRRANTTHTDIKTVRAIVKGPIKEIKALDKDVLLYNVKYLQNMTISRARRTAVYKTVKGNRRLDEMTIAELEQLGDFVMGVTSSDLSTELDCTKVEIVAFLGKSHLKKKLLGCLAQCLKKEFGKQVYLSYKFINKFGGIICGYGVEELEQIDEDNFVLIDEEVFIHLDQCNEHQLRALYNIAIRSTVYGIPQGWSKSVVRTIGILLTITPLLDLMGMDPMSFQDVKPNVLKEMSSVKRDVLKHYLRSYALRSRKEIWKKLGLPSSSLKKYFAIRYVIFFIVCLKFI